MREELKRAKTAERSPRYEELEELEMSLDEEDEGKLEEARGSSAPAGTSTL